MKRVIYLPRRRKFTQPRKFRAWNSVIAICLAIAIIIIPTSILKINHLTVQADMVPQLQQKVTTIQQQKNEADKTNKEYQSQLLKYSTLVTADPQTASIVNYYIDLYFGKQADTARRIFTCESHLNPTPVHVNAPGLGEDVGVSQLNSVYQSKRFASMYPGIPFDIGAKDISMNLKVAQQIYQQDGWGPWVCARLLGVTK